MKLATPQDIKRLEVKTYCIPFHHILLSSVKNVRCSAGMRPEKTRFGHSS